MGGNCAENTAKKLNISLAEQDECGMNSYKRAADAYESGSIQPEIFPVSVEQKRGKALIHKEDEEYNLEKFTKLATVFQRENGTVTAGNASTLSDGAAACILMSCSSEAEKRDLKPLARIVDYADGATDPIDFPIAPRIANDRLQ